MIADPICDLLSADGTITGDLATFEGSAAIFDFAPAPERCHQPLITVEEAGGGWTGARGIRGFRIRATISIWGNKTYSRVTLRDISKAVWAAVDRQNLTLIAPYCERGCWADAPQEVTDRDGFPGIIIPVEVLVHKY